jgi:hypothetical protein
MIFITDTILESVPVQIYDTDIAVLATNHIIYILEATHIMICGHLTLLTVSIIVLNHAHL